ncbi:MAG TPA: polysaccharide deacetylase family protein [Candidatus Limnocylindrales bacterium]
MRVALTFDAEHPDRPHRPGVQEGILDLLRDRTVRATFFLQGRWVEAFPHTARRIGREGHLVGSHSFYHARMPLLSDGGVATDVRDAEDAIRAIVGVDPRPWFRCPFFAGAEDPRILGILAGLGYREVPSDVVLDDWDPDRTGAAIAADALAAVAAAADGAIVLFHTWPPQTLDALPAIVDGLRAKGAEFVTIAELPAERWALAVP